MTRTVSLTAVELAHAEKHCHGAEARRRCANELRVLKLTCQTAIKAGYSVSLQDGEEWVVKRSTNVHELVMAAQSTDMDRLQIRKIDDVATPLGTILFVYGNSGCEVIADYHVSLEELLKPVNAYTDYLSSRGE